MTQYIGRVRQQINYSTNQILRVTHKKKFCGHYHTIECVRFMNESIRQTNTQMTTHQWFRNFRCRHSMCCCHCFLWAVLVTRLSLVLLDSFLIWPLAVERPTKTCPCRLTWRQPNWAVAAAVVDRLKLLVLPPALVAQWAQQELNSASTHQNLAAVELLVADC